MDSAPLDLAIVLDPLLYASEPIPTHEGLNVVYGLNGAGKTRLLDGIRNALRGVYADARVGLLVHATRDRHGAATSPYELQDSITTALAKAIADPGDFEYFTPGKPLLSHVLSPQRASEILDEYLLERVPSFGEAHDWVLANRLFLMTPTGTESAPAWEAWAVTDPRLDWVKKEEQLLDAVFDAYDAGYSFHDDDDYSEEKQAAHEAEYRDKVARATLFPAHDREVFPGLTGHVWHLGPYSPIGYGYDSAASLNSIVVSGEVDFGLDIVDYTRSIEAATSEYLRDSLPNLPETWDSADSPSLESMESSATQVAERLSTEVTELIRSTLLDAPFARLELAHPSERLFKSPFEWKFSRRHDRLREVALEKLSRAERIWAERAILEATHKTRKRGRGLRPTLHLYDEPETALHRSAERHMARGLTKLAVEGNRVVVAATHSPLLIDAPRANVIEVKRDAGGFGRSVLQPLDPGGRRALDGLGLLPSDLLNRTRVFFLVEGTHDEILFRTWFGRRLDEAFVRVLPMRGAQKLPGTIDTKVLFDFTDAHLVALLDNLDPVQVRETWELAQRVRLTDGVAAAKEVVLTGLPGRDEEPRALREWLTAALDKGVDGRITPMSLSAGDIIEYVRNQELLPESASWEQLRADHEAARARKSKGHPPFKQWLFEEYGLFVSEELLRDAALASPIPREFEEIMNSLEALSESSWDEAGRAP